MNQRKFSFAITITLVFLGCCTHASAQNGGHLYVVVATDDNDKNVGLHVRQDSLTIQGALTGNVAERDVTFTKVDPNSLNRQTILKTIRAQPAGPNDAIFVYYSGHGAYHPTIGQYFWLSGPQERLPRTEVHDAIEKKNPRLGILISDCCYNLFQEPPSLVSPASSAPTKPLFDELFFQARGFVDITAAKEGEFAMCHPAPSMGSIFTKAVDEVLWDQQESRLNWKEVFELVRRKTAQSFTDVHPRGVKSQNGGAVQQTQTPWAFELPE